MRDLDYVDVITINRAYLEATMGEMTIRHYTDWDWQGDPTRFCWLRLAVEDKAAIPDADAQIIAQAHQFGYIGEHQSSPMMSQMVVVELPGEI